MDDIIVVVPGILGSVLKRDGRTVWGSGSVLSAGRLVRRLTLPEGLGDAAPDDAHRLEATGLMHGIAIVPGFWRVGGGYRGLLKYLYAKFAVDERNLLEFPYDWRLSNRFTAQALASFADQRLERWRLASGNRDAKVILIAHSMGGLVARYFVECCGGWDITRRVITIGTPHAGAVKALDVLSNGYLRVRRLRIPVRNLVDSLPSLPQLLPTYDCVVTSSTVRVPITKVPVPNVKQATILMGKSFHEDIAAGVKCRRDGSLHVIYGHSQPTDEFVTLSSGGVTPRRAHGSVSRAGDGTVPRVAAVPPEWEDDTRAFAQAQCHSALVDTDSVFEQLFGWLTAIERGRRAGRRELTIDVTDAALAGDDIEFSVRVDDNDRADLELVVDGPKRYVVESMLRTGDGRYFCKIQDMRKGAYRWRIRSPSDPSIDPVSDVLGIIDRGDLIDTP
jgi:hypothetical protein